tara:strand:- start:157 stop:375 length:219 start_codon:yes stop_codon:yes gene_type:complete
MKYEYLCVFSGNHVDTLNVIYSLSKININPIIKNESESARLAGFGIISDKKKIYVHRDEFLKAEKLVKSIIQ